MKKTALLFAILFLVLTVNAQDFLWVTNFGGAVNADQSSGNAVDAAGDVYSAGYYHGTLDFDPGVGVYNLPATTGGYSNAYISKLDASGNFIWAKSIGNGNQLHVGSITADAAGNVYLFGGFAGTPDFNPGAGVFNMTGTPSVGGLYSSVFITKLDVSGNFVWAKSFGSTGNFNYFLESSIAVDASGNVFTSFGFKGTVDFDPGAGTFNLTATAIAGALFSNVYISKLDANGNFVWAKSIAGTNNVNIGSIAIDANGNVYAAGNFSGTGDFDPGAGSFNLTSSSVAHSAYILKLSANGNYVWAKTFLGTYTSCNSVALDAAGSIYSYGKFNGTIDFDPTAGVNNVTSSANGDVYVCKLDANGNFAWVKNIEANLPYRMNVDPLGNVYFSGEFGYTVDFNPGAGVYNLTAVSGHSSGFVAKLNSAGNFVWAKSFNDSDGFINMSGLCISPTGEINITGDYQNTIDFDPNLGIFNLTPLGYYDVFILQLNSCSNSSSFISPNVCQSYTSPSGNHTWTSSGTYYDTIPNASTCDSIITINLTIINKPTFSFSTNGMVASFSIVSSGCNTFVWDFGNGNTSTINPNPIVTYATAGTYGVCLQCNGQPTSCIQCFNITVPSNTSGTTEIKVIQNVSGISVYPNPSNGFVSIEIKNGKANTPYFIVNSLGQEILAGKLLGEITTVDINNLFAGIYLIQFGEEKTQSFKIVKK